MPGTKRKHSRWLWVIALAGLWNVGCTEHILYSEFRDLPSEGWSAKDTLDFFVEIQDTVHPFDCYIHVRNDLDYPFSNLFLITSVVDPSGRGQKDTLEYEMAAPDGTWLGSGVGSLKESKLWFRERKVFSEPGTYRFRIRHAMRRNGEVEGVDVLRGVTHLGLEIERSK